MYLSPTFKDMHEVNHVNITLTDVCLATGEIEVPGAEPQLSAIQSFAISLSNFYGYDTAIINQLMYGMKGMSDFRGFSAGFIQSFRTGEYWSWRPTLMLLGKDLGVVEFLLYKVSELREWVGERVRQTTNSPFQSKPVRCCAKRGGSIFLDFGSDRTHREGADLERRGDNVLRVQVPANFGSWGWSERQSFELELSVDWKRD